VVVSLPLSVWLFVALILATGAERIFEMVISRRNASRAFARGGVEYGQRQMPLMIALHTGMLLGAIVEVVLFDRPFLGAIGWAFLVIAVACQAGRYWVIWALGEQWNTRVIVVPGARRVSRGPYSISWLRHPNYWIVAIEGLALPLVHSAWITALVFTVLNAVLLLGFRIPVENRALAALK
jgi:methyltransferase